MLTMMYHDNFILLSGSLKTVVFQDEDFDQRAEKYVWYVWLHANIKSQAPAAFLLSSDYFWLQSKQ